MVGGPYAVPHPRLRWVVHRPFWLPSVALSLVLVLLFLVPPPVVSVGPTAPPSAAFRFTGADPVIENALAQPPAPSSWPAQAFLAAAPSGTNWYIGNWTGEGAIAQNPADPGNLVVGGVDYLLPVEGNDSAGYDKVGDSGAFTTVNGGSSWSTRFLPGNSTWFNTSSWECGQLNDGDASIVFGPNDTVYYFEMSVDFNLVSGCSHSNGPALYVSISHDGGRSWGTPVGIAGYGSLSNLDRPWAAINESTGEVYVAYSDNTAHAACVKESQDGGASWSASECLGNYSGTDYALDTQLVLDPFGGIDLTWARYSNDAIYFARSVDQAATFSTPKVIGTFPAYDPSDSPDAFRDHTWPILGVDGSSVSPYRGRLYCVWQNGSGGVGGSPKVTLVWSNDSGSRWSGPVTVNSNVSFMDFQPFIASGPDGTVYADWYAGDPTDGNYTFFGSESHDGGRSFDHPFAISDRTSDPRSTGTNTNWIGDLTDTLVNRSGAFPVWTDTRSNQSDYCMPCGGTFQNISLYWAEMTNSTVAANVPVPLQVNDSRSGAQMVPVNTSLTYLDWLGGSTYQVSAPSQVNVNGTPWHFALWYGQQVTNSTNVSGAVTGAMILRACYVVQAGSLCDAPGAPGRIEIRVDPTIANVAVNGSAISLNSGMATLWEPAGNYSVDVNAPGYLGIARPVSVHAGNTSYVNVTLLRVPGFLSGTVSPVGASLTVNGTGVSVQANGSFNATLAPGIYSVEAVAQGYAPYVDPSVAVYSGTTTRLTIRLSASPGWINGTVSPSSASVRLNGFPLATTNGSFSTTLSPGAYWLNATASGYLPATTGEVIVRSGMTSDESLTLARSNGTLTGTISPANASLSLNGTPVAVQAGTFHATVPWGVFALAASAYQHLNANRTVVVPFNSSLVVSLDLAWAVGWVTGEVSPAGANLLVNGTRVAVDPGGHFNRTLLPGVYSLNASFSGYRAYGSLVRVTAGNSTSAGILLSQEPSTSFDWTPWAIGGGLAIGLAGLLLFVGRRQRRRQGTRPDSSSK